MDLKMQSAPGKENKKKNNKKKTISKFRESE